MPLDSYIVSTDDLVPPSSSWTGTISSAGKIVTGSSTLFTTELQKGAWIWSVAGHEVRQVVWIVSDTELQLDAPFTADLSGVDLKGVSKEDGKVVFMEIKNLGTASTIDNVALEADGVYTQGQPNWVGRGKTFCRPKHYDGATGSARVTLTMFGNRQV